MNNPITITSATPPLKPQSITVKIQKEVEPVEPEPIIPQPIEEVVPTVKEEIVEEKPAVERVVERIVQAPQSKVKLYAICFISAFIGILIFFAVLRYQNSWATKLLFNGINKQLEEQVKEKEKVIANLQSDNEALSAQKSTLQAKLDDNAKVIADLRARGGAATASASKLKQKELAAAFTKLGY